MENIEAPAGIAAIITNALRNAGVTTGSPSADTQPGGDGFLDIRTPDGLTYRIRITCES